MSEQNPLDAWRQREAQILDDARPDAAAKRHAKGYRTARENLADLVDDDSFIEYGSLAVAAQRGRRSLDELRAETPADGVLTGLATINAVSFGAEASRAAVIVNDYSVLAGTQGYFHHAKIDRILAVVRERRLPVVMFAEGGGGRPGDVDVQIAMVGKYVDLADAYKSINEALYHAGLHTHTRVKIRYIESETLESHGLRVLQGADAILVPGGFGERGIEGKVLAAKYARENRIPYLGICLGMQVAVIEYARNVCDLAKAHSTEFNPHTPHPVIGLVTEWLDATGQVETRAADSDLGGTMRLGVQRCRLQSGSRCRAMYNSEVISERHRHRYEFNNSYRETLTGKGLRLAGLSDDGELVEIIEVPDHPWFVGVQFHPEFTSTPRDGHPLFEGFVKAAREHYLEHREPSESAAASKPRAAASN